jgi:predicted dehydrogenase
MGDNSMASERVIVVGAGGISNAWFPPIGKEQLQVAAVVDLQKAAAEAQIDKYKLTGTIASNDLDKTLRETQADFVLNLTIPAAHAEVTCKALEAGFPVIGEKPLAETMEQAHRMLETSEKTGKLFMVSQSRRWVDRHESVRQTIASGEIGEMTTLNCDFFLAAHFGGFRDEMASPLILDMAIHHFDLARMFTGRDAVSVYAEEYNPSGSWYRGDVAANCLFEMTGGLRFAYRGSWCAEGCHTSWNGDWRAIGERGTILYDHDHPPEGEVVAGKEGFNRPLAPARITEAKMEFEGMHGGLREMLRYLREGVMPQTECHDNIKSLAMVLGAVESARSGKRVQIPA